MNVIEYQKLLDEMPSFGPLVETHPMFWGEKQRKALEDFRGTHKELFASPQLDPEIEGVLRAEALYKQFQAEREARDKARPPDVFHPEGDISLKGLRSRLPPEFGGNVNPHYDMTVEEATKAGVIPPEKVLKQLGAKPEQILQDLNDEAWRQEYNKAQLEGRSARRFHESKAQVEKRISDAHAAAVKHGVGTALTFSDAMIPGSAELDKGIARGAGELVTRAGSALGYQMDPDAPAAGERYLDEAQAGTPAALKIAAGLAGGVLSPLNKLKGLGLLAGADEATKGVGVISGMARGAAAGAGNSVLGGEVNDMARALRQAATDGQDKGVAVRAKEFMQDQQDAFPARLALGLGLGAVAGGAQGFGRGMRDQMDPRTEAFRDFESLGGTTSAFSPGGLKGTPEMELYQKLRMPNRGSPSDEATQAASRLTTELAHGRTKAMEAAHGETNQAYYNYADNRDFRATPRQLVKDAIAMNQRGRFSLDEVKDDLALHKNEVIRKLVRDSSDPVVMDDYEAGKMMERTGAARMGVREALDQKLIDPDELLQVHGVGKVPAGKLAAEDTMNIVFEPRAMTARELDDVIASWHVAKKASAVKNGGAAHPMFDELYPGIREARSQLPGVPPITRPDEFEVIRGAGGETKRTSGWDATKEIHHREMSKDEADLKQLGINGKIADPLDESVHAAVAPNVAMYGERGVTNLPKTQALDNLYLQAGMTTKPLETIRGLRLLEGELSPERVGKSSSLGGAVLKTIQANKYRFDPAARALSSRFGGLTTAATDPLTAALLELQQKQGQH